MCVVALQDSLQTWQHTRTCFISKARLAGSAALNVGISSNKSMEALMASLLDWGALIGPNSSAWRIATTVDRIVVGHPPAPNRTMSRKRVRDGLASATWRVHGWVGGWV